MATYSCPYVSQNDLSPDLIIYRVVHPKFVDWTKLDDIGLPLMTSQVFQENRPERARELGYPEPAVSIAFAHVLERDAQHIDVLLEDFDDSWGIAQLTVGSVREVVPEVGVRHDAIHRPWHGILFSVTRSQLKGEKGALRDRARLIRAPRPTT